MGAALSRALRTAIGALTLAAIAALGLLPAPQPTDATSFNPELTVSLSSTAPDSPTDIRFDFSISSPDANFDSFVTFIPTEFGMAPDAEVPDGAIVGQLAAISTLSLLNGPCNSNVTVSFELMEATTNTDFTIPLYAGYGDYNGNGLPENVDQYPSFLQQVAPNITPRERLYGQTLVAGTQTFINFVIFEPGAAIPNLPVLDPALGYPTLVFLNDPKQPPQPLPINDFCSPLQTTTIMNATSGDNAQTGANEDGVELRRTPVAAGDYEVVSFVRSQWDADDDGIENNLDPCALTFNPGWDPRAASFLGDSDSDGLPNDCDPTAAYNSDQDADGYSNRQDICPLIAVYYPEDIDHDLIGDACDPAPSDPSNGGSAHRHEVCVIETLTIGSGGPAAPDHTCPSGPDVPVPLLLDVIPGNGVRPVATLHNLVAYVRDPTISSYGNLPGAEVTFEVTGANPTSGTCATELYTSCEFSYLGANLGEDTIVATAEHGGRTVTETSHVTWMLPPPNDDFLDGEDLTLFPASVMAAIPAASSPSGEPHACDRASQTVWYDLTSDTDRYVRIEAAAEGMYTYLALYSNAPVGGFRGVACGYDYYEDFDPEEGPGTVESYLFAHLPAGQTLYLQVSGGSLGDELPVDVALDIEDAVEGDTDCDDDSDIEDILTILLAYDSAELTECYGAGDWECTGYLNPRDVVPALAYLAGVGPPIQDCVPDYYGGPIDF